MNNPSQQLKELLKIRTKQEEQAYQTYFICNKIIHLMSQYSHFGYDTFIHNMYEKSKKTVSRQIEDTVNYSPDVINTAYQKAKYDLEVLEDFIKQFNAGQPVSLIQVGLMVQLKPTEYKSYFEEADLIHDPPTILTNDFEEVIELTDEEMEEFNPSLLRRIKMWFKKWI